MVALLLLKSNTNEIKHLTGYFDTYNPDATCDIHWRLEINSIQVDRLAIDLHELLFDTKPNKVLSASRFNQLADIHLSITSIHSARCDNQRSHESDLSWK